METSPIALEDVTYTFGSGELQRDVLSDVSVEIRPGELVIITGPSGSGKTTLLTLIGALRSVQGGSLKVLGREFRGASAADLENVRKDIGYIFQAHNLLDALTASQNVQLSLLLHRELRRGEVRRRADEALEAVGLGDRTESFPGQLSGGQRQRVAIARALAGRPRIILADEPTASLDKKTGHDVVELMRDLAKKDGVSVLMVTHDSRILDVADRILHLEDGRLQSLHQAVMASTQHMLSLLAQSNRKGELTRIVHEMPDAQFVEMLEQVTSETQEFLNVMEMGNDLAFGSMLEQTLEVFTYKLGAILDAERASIFLVDEETDELRVQVAERGGLAGYRMPRSAGIAGQVATTGRSLRVEDAYTDPRFNPEVDRRTGFRTRSILCVPIRDSEKRVFAVAELLNRRDGEPFSAEDEARFDRFLESIAVILEAWSDMRRARGSGTESAPGAS
jgi:putative ABC transport system ATP-binding protein